MSPGKATPNQEVARERGSVILTLLLDTLVTVTAIGARWLVLSMIAKLVPADEHGFAIVWLERIFNVGLVFAALVLTSFDVAKILVRSFKSLMREFKE